MRRYFSKEEKEQFEFCDQVAKKFGINPISIRASRLLNSHCESADQVKEWLRSKHILKIRQMGKKTLRELYCAFGYCKEYAPSGHADKCALHPMPRINYREMLKDYAQIFRR